MVSKLRVLTKCYWCGGLCDRFGKPVDTDPIEAGLLPNAPLVYGQCCKWEDNQAKLKL
jgi:hypothetical protein